MIAFPYTQYGENIIKFAVYTDEFQTRLAQIGARVGALFSGGFSSTFATTDSVLIKDELEAMYDETAETMKGIDNLLDSIFGKTTETIEKELSAFTQLINNFEEQLKAGAIAFSDDGMPIENARMIREAMIKISAVIF